MKHLVLLAHAPPAVAAKYEAALRDAGVDARVVVILSTHGAFSSAYVATAAENRVNGRILGNLVARYAGAGPFASVSLATFSAGYALARALPPEDWDELAAYVAIDSVHSGLDGDGTAGDALLAPFVRQAKRARDGLATFWLGHSDVQTPQKGPTAFASTTQVARELVRLAGEPGHGWHVQAFDVRDAAHAKEEHGAALNEWGPAFVAGAVAYALDEDEAPRVPREPSMPPSVVPPSAPPGFPGPPENVRAWQVKSALYARPADWPGAWGWPLKVDDLWGPRTQRAMALMVSGKLDALPPLVTLDDADVHDAPASPPLPPPAAIPLESVDLPLKRGDDGSEVKALQLALLHVGFAPGKADGDYGPKTEAAVVALQRYAGLPKTGVFDEEEMAALGRHPGMAGAASAEAPVGEAAGGSLVTGGGTLGEALLAGMLAVVGTREEPPSSNSSPLIDSWLQAAGILLPVPRAKKGPNYCAAAVRAKLHEAADALGVTPPIEGSAGAKATKDQLIDAKRWYTAKQLRADPTLLRPGMLWVWDRSDGILGHEWWGHIGVGKNPMLNATKGVAWLVAEANSGNGGEECAIMTRRLDDPRLLGAGWVD